jgi:hypothetical protein
MSARAAWRLEQLGFDDIHDYVAGRRDWQEAGLPVKGTDVRGPTVADAMTLEPPTCSPDDHVGAARALLGESTQVVVATRPESSLASCGRRVGRPLTTWRSGM